MQRNRSTIGALALTVGSREFVAPAGISVPAKRANRKQSKPSSSLATLMMLGFVGGVVLVSRTWRWGRPASRTWALNRVPGYHGMTTQRKMRQDHAVRVSGTYGPFITLVEEKKQ